MLKRFLKYYKPYLKLFLAVNLCGLANTAAGVVYPVITRYMLNDLIPNRKYELILRFGVALLFVYILKMILKFCLDYYGHVVGTNVQADMRKELFDKLEALPFSFYDDNETGKIMSRMTNDIFEISELAHHGPEMLVSTSFSLIFSLFYLSRINLTLALIIFSCAPFLFLITMLVRKKHIRSVRESRKAMAEINGNLNSSISGIRTTKAFNNAEKEIEKFDEGNVGFIKARMGHIYTMSVQHAATTFVTDLFNVVCLISGGIFLYNGKISFGDYSSFIISVSMFTSPILQMVQWMEQFDNGATGFERFCEIMDVPEETDREGARAVDDLSGDICFDHVSFSYVRDEGREVLDDISFTVKEGKTIALVGPSGGGKTTICHLLPKFYHPEKGVISIGGIDIEDITMRSLREHIGIVQQDVFLFSGTFRENISYGRKDASVEEIVSAAKKANIYDYIMSLPETFDTQIGERGIKLSGGQKQRLSIARVFLKNPEILILDEATSSLDNATEILIQQALDSLKEGRTTIVVAHRLSTIRNADEIIVVSNGRIIESGSHEQLLKKKNGVYRKLHDSQFSGNDYGIDEKMMMS